MNKRVLTIQDFSCLGRCSLTVAIPTLSAAGLETVAIPTAILSNHTAFASWTFHDLTEEMNPIVEKWMTYRHAFDYIYTGYLSNDQIPTVQGIIDRLRTDQTTVIVDPAMADHGKLYAGFDMAHVTAMKALIKEADIIVPNLTEACFLSDVTFPGTEEGVPLSFYQGVAKKLLSLGPKRIVISGQNLKHGYVADLIFEGSNESVYETEAYAGLFHGTGDLFASAFVGALGNGFPLKEAVGIAHDYVHEAIRITNENGSDGVLYGPEFERALPLYVQRLGLFKK